MRPLCCTCFVDFAECTGVSVQCVPFVWMACACHEPRVAVRVRLARLARRSPTYPVCVCPAGLCGGAGGDLCRLCFGLRRRLSRGRRALASGTDSMDFRSLVGSTASSLPLLARCLETRHTPGNSEQGSYKHRSECHCQRGAAACRSARTALLVLRAEQAAARSASGSARRVTTDV